MIVPRRLLSASLVSVGALLVAAAPGHASNDVPLFPQSDMQKYCEGLGGTYSGNANGFTCRLPNGDEFWCDYVSVGHAWCGYIDRGKPAPKASKPKLITGANALSDTRLAPSKP